MTKQITANRVKKSEFGHAPRLYSKATFLGFRRGKSVTHENHALVSVENLSDVKDTSFYFGKRIVYIYRHKGGYRSIWGRVMKAHGSNGVLRAKFTSNLPARAMGGALRVMLYPNKA